MSQVLKVNGNSLDKYGIFNGDYVICQETNKAKARDLVITKLDNGLMSLREYTNGMPVFSRVEGVIRKYDERKI